MNLMKLRIVYRHRLIHSSCYEAGLSRNRYENQKIKHQREKNKQEKAMKEVVSFVDSVERGNTPGYPTVGYKVKKHSRKLPKIQKYRSVSG